jgi:hypothetical protein
MHPISPGSTHIPLHYAQPLCKYVLCLRYSQPQQHYNSNSMPFLHIYRIIVAIRIRTSTALSSTCNAHSHQLTS